MYSPKISERLIPSLYRLAKSREIPMTELVNEFIYDALAEEIALVDVQREIRETDRNPHGTTAEENQEKVGLRS